MQKNEPTTRPVTRKCRTPLFRCYLNIFVSLCLIEAVAAASFAQPLIDSVASIDSLVINADYVYIGKITKVRDAPIPGGTKMPGFTFEVDEYLKAPMEENLTSKIKQRGMFVSPPTTKYKDWMDRSCQLLIISNDSRPNPPTVIELTPNTAPVFTAKFSLLRDPREIIQAAKHAIKRTPSNIRRLSTHRLMLPSETYIGTRWEAGGGLMLEVPADVQLENWAIDSLDHQNSLNRRQATQSLRHFKSKRNADLVAKLLHDPDPDVRLAAQQTLKRWEIQSSR